MARSSVSHPTALRPLVAAVVAFLCVFACASFPVAASAAPARVLHVPVDSELFLPCANDGAGEVVHFTGMILGVFKGTFDGAGESIRSPSRSSRGTGSGDDRTQVRRALREPLQHHRVRWVPAGLLG